MFGVLGAIDAVPSSMAEAAPSGSKDGSTKRKWQTRHRAQLDGHHVVTDATPVREARRVAADETQGCSGQPEPSAAPPR